MVDKNGKSVTTLAEVNSNEVQFDAVVTIAPRQDIANIDSDIPEAMVTCICQVGQQSGGWVKGTKTDSNTLFCLLLLCLTTYFSFGLRYGFLFNRRSDCAYGDLCEGQSA
jgi:hypothetical protein